MTASTEKNSIETAAVAQSNIPSSNDVVKHRVMTDELLLETAAVAAHDGNTVPTNPLLNLKVRKNDNTEDDSDVSTASLSSFSNHSSSFRSSNDDHSEDSTYVVIDHDGDYSKEEESSLSSNDDEDLQKEESQSDACNNQQALPSLSPTSTESRVLVSSSFSTIPIVDLSLSPNVILDSVRRACREVGFMYLVNSGLSSTVSNRTFELSRQFFRETKREYKLQVENTKSKSGARGYFVLGAENLGMSGGDWKEGFDCGRDDITTDECNEHCMVDTNQWPLPNNENATVTTDECNDYNANNFRSGIMEYQSEAMNVAHNLLSYIAIGLDCPPDFFTRRMQKPMVTLRLLHYPPLTEEVPSSNKIGCGAHTDYGCVTILNQDNVGGLEIYNKFTKKWIDAPPIQDSLVINLGDMMQRWTNEVYPSTIHRVKLNTGNKHRYSIPFFINPDVGTIVECLPSCSNGKKVLYPPEKSEEILRQRWEDAFKDSKK